MLGDRRNHSLFAPAAAISVPESKPEQAEVHDIAFEEDTGRSIFAESKVAPKASDIFFAPLDKGCLFQRYSVRCSPTSPVPMPP